MISIVPVYAAILAILLIILSLRVIKIRRREKIAIGDGGVPDLQRAICVHTNFCQYTPFALILFTFIELQQAPIMWVNFLCLLFLFGRILHAYGVSHVNENLRIRKSGMIMTFLSLIFSIVTILILKMY
jgi:uncharacterized membrane protein YecN with MAPEG domain